MGKTTNMQYALYDEKCCRENMCGSFYAAQKLASKIKESCPQKRLFIYRYDRSGYSDYNEMVLEIS